jgi:hypothetical protein
VREESEVADSNKPSRQEMKQKAPQKLIGAKRHEPLLVFVGRIPPAERHLIAVEAD